MGKLQLDIESELICIMKSLAMVGLHFYDKSGHCKTLLNVRGIRVLKTFTESILTAGTVLSPLNALFY